MILPTGAQIAESTQGVQLTVFSLNQSTKLKTGISPTAEMLKDSYTAKISHRTH